jgi:hypothetical protein
MWWGRCYISWADMIISMPTMGMPVDDYRAAPIVRTIVSAIPTIINWWIRVVIGYANFCGTASKNSHAGQDTD